jgi:hypothetical protein
MDWAAGVQGRPVKQHRDTATMGGSRQHILFGPLCALCRYAGAGALPARTTTAGRWQAGTVRMTIRNWNAIGLFQDALAPGGLSRPMPGPPPIQFRRL